MTLLVAAVTALAALGSSAASGFALVYTGESLKATRDQIRLAEQGQITERYGRAVEQIGDNTLDVRVGGIFALERLMHDSPQDQPTIVEVLAAFIREHTAHRKTPPTPRSVGAERLLPAPPADVQAALTVIGRRDHRRDGGRKVDLSYANLSGANLSGAYLAGAELEGVDLTGAIMLRANLTGAHLLSANLSFASCRWANFTNAGMVKAVLINAFLYDANLNKAMLVNANLRRAFLSGATFKGADLRSANLTDVVGANLAGAQR